MRSLQKLTDTDKESVSRLCRLFCISISLQDNLRQDQLLPGKYSPRVTPLSVKPEHVRHLAPVPDTSVKPGFFEACNSRLAFHSGIVVTIQSTLQAVTNQEMQVLHLKSYWHISMPQCPDSFGIEIHSIHPRHDDVNAQYPSTVAPSQK